ncbi:hypothetical protein M5689_006615 [Euphorbia peplus]|nr:hypothetical protein M5689_006615 [Euphorbia peplus]
MSNHENNNDDHTLSKESVGQNAGTGSIGNASQGVPNMPEVMQQFVNAIGTMAAQIQNQFQNDQPGRQPVPIFDRNIQGIRMMGAETFFQ